MTNKEMDSIKEYFSNTITITKDELLTYIVKTFENRVEKNFTFYTLDLKRNGVLYQLNKNTYKLSDRKLYKEKPRKYIEDIYMKLKQEFDIPNVCIWETKTLYKYMVHQPMSNIIFVEVPNYIVNDVYYYLQFNLTETKIISKKDKAMIHDMHYIDLIFVTSLHENAPIYARVSNNITNKKIGAKVIDRKQTLQLPKIEKIIVELFVDKYNIGIINKTEELVNVFEGIFEHYQVNISSLYTYSRWRYVNDELFDYIENVVRFNVETGEFYDR